MKRKFFGFIALAAFAITSGISAVSANVQENTIWVYADDGTTADSPDCRNPDDNVCAQRHEYDPINGTVGAPLTGPNDFAYGERP